jgi:hypothetical protein
MPLDTTASIVADTQSPSPSFSVSADQHSQEIKNLQPGEDGFADEMLFRVFGDRMVNGPGKCLNNEWCVRWTQLVAVPAQAFNVVGGHIGGRVVDAVTREVELLATGKEPSDRLNVFLRVLTQRVDGVKGWNDTRRVLQRRLEDWEAGNFDKLVQETLRASALFKSRVHRSQPSGADSEHTQRVFCRLIDEGKVRAAVRFLAERDKGGVLHPDESIAMKGQHVRVRDVLLEKHPEPKEPGPAAMTPYALLPEFPSLDITAETIEFVAKQLQGGAGPSGVHALWWEH